MDEYFAIGFQESLQKAANSSDGIDTDGMLMPDDFSIEDALDMPFFDKQDGAMEVKSPENESNPQKIPKSIDPSKS